MFLSQIIVSVIRILNNIQMMDKASLMACLIRLFTAFLESLNFCLVVVSWFFSLLLFLFHAKKLQQFAELLSFENTWSTCWKHLMKSIKICRTICRIYKLFLVLETAIRIEREKVFHFSNCKSTTTFSI